MTLFVPRFRLILTGLLWMVLSCYLPSLTTAAPKETKIWIVRTAGDPLLEQFFEDCQAADKGPVKGLKGYYRIDFKKSPLDKEAIEKLLEANDSILWYEQQFLNQTVRPHVIPGSPMDDPHFYESWHIANTGRKNGNRGEDLNLLPTWDWGVDGSGVLIAVVDDGVEFSHPDLQGNIQQDLALDLVNDPGPNQLTSDNSHGTAVSGIIAAQDNEIGSVGVAYGARIVPIRYLGVDQTDGTTAEALSHESDSISVYNNSWGPVYEIGEGEDKTTAVAMLGPDRLSRLAIAQGTTSGRGGLGNIFVFSAGNDAEIGANVNYNGWANIRQTIAVGSVGNGGKYVSYSDPGAPLLVCAPSGGQSLGIFTTDRVGALGYEPTDYVGNFSGTSASAPMVSGVIALMLQANPLLTWRDVQHILVKTAIQIDREDDGWLTNGGGLPVNYKYGFGRVDASSAIQTAVGWTNVGNEVSTGVSTYVNQGIPNNNGSDLSSTLEVTHNIKIEHVDVTIAMDHSDWGDLSIILTSPSGTESVLAIPHEDGIGDYSSWTYSSARHWDEESQGQWTLRVADQGTAGTGQLTRWNLTIYGTVFDDERNLDPIAMLDSYLIRDYPATLPVLANDSDPDGDTMRIISLYQGQSGNLSITPNQEILYTPDATSLGIDYFGYSISDGRGGIDDALVELIDPGPVPVPDQVVVEMNHSITIPVLQNDFDRSGDAIELVSVSEPQEGTVTIEESNVTYTPSEDFVGLETLQYTITDNNDGERQGAVRAFVSANNDFGLLFDGINDSVEVEASPSLNITQAITMEARFYLRSYGEFGDPGFGRILDRDTFSMFVNGEGHQSYPDHCLVVAFDLLNGNTATANSPVNTIQLNRWHTVSVTYNRSTVNMYIDGQPVETQMLFGSLLGSIQGSPNAKLILGEAGNQERAFDGIIDWVRLWNIARPTTALLDADMEPSVNDRSGLVGWWKFTEGVGTATLDQSGNLNNGSVAEALWCPVDPSLLSSVLEPR